MATDEEILAIYKAYPRRKHRPRALRAIANAIKRLEGEDVPNAALWLRARVVAYAKERQGQRSTFTPYPASWMNAEGYDDEPEDRTFMDRPTKDPKTDIGSDDAFT